MQIRTAMPSDAQAISALIQSLATYFTVHPDGSGAEDFLKTISTQAIAQCTRDPDFLYLVGYVDEHLAGVVSVRGNKHLYHLFVSPAFQRLGYARELWEAAKEQAVQRGNAGEFTVNASPFAEPVYTKFGFEATGPRVETKGIAFIPMQLRPRA
jgi:ribosomal protein S18 acetylase RimI-like enzyme